MDAPYLINDELGIFFMIHEHLVNIVVYHQAMTPLMEQMVLL